MSAISIVNLLESLSNQNTAQGQDTQAAQSTAHLALAQTAQDLAQDEFTPSSQNGQAQATAQAAGLFSITGSSLFSPAANSLLAQRNAPAPAPTEQTAASVASAAQAPETPAAAPSLLATQQQLQSLNLALAALGLSTQDIEQLDQIASTINDYNPAVFTSQAYQLEAAQRAAEQAAAAAKAQAAPAATKPTPPTPQNTKATTGETVNA